MKVLVSGLLGYIGVMLGMELEEHKHEVIGLDTGFYAGKSFYSDGARSFPLIRKDIRKVTEDDLMGVDAVVHLADQIGNYVDIGTITASRYTTNPVKFSWTGRTTTATATDTVTASAFGFGPSPPPVWGIHFSKSKVQPKNSPSNRPQGRRSLPHGQERQGRACSVPDAQALSLNLASILLVTGRVLDTS